MIQPRNLPPELITAELQADEWWAGQLRALPSDAATAIFLLCRMATRAIGDLGQRLMPKAPEEFHAQVRGYLFGLANALTGIRGPLPVGKLPATFVLSNFTSANDEAVAAGVLRKGYDYSLARDAYITFKWGGYDVDSPAPGLLRFRDVPGWNGRRDAAVRILSQQVDRESVPAVVPVRIALHQTYAGPPDVTLGKLTASEFRQAWSVLFETSAAQTFTGDCEVMSKDDLVSLVRNRANLTADAAEGFIQLITFDRFDPLSRGALSLFHCPLVPVTDSSLIVIAPGLMFSNLTTCVNRLAVHRGPGLNTISKKIEEYYLGLLKRQFETHDVHVRTTVPYTASGKRHDIDLVVYETQNGRVLLGMLKGFIYPDTVEEVIRANERLAEGIEQAREARAWFESQKLGSWESTLAIPSGLRCRSTHYVVMGNGFAGSEYLPFDLGIPVVDARYLLLERFCGRSIFEAINEYSDWLDKLMRGAAPSSKTGSVTLGNIAFEFPA